MDFENVNSNNENVVESNLIPKGLNVPRVTKSVLGNVT
jgi:hypothetical protein